MTGSRVEELASVVACLPAMTPQRLHKLAESTRPCSGAGRVAIPGDVVVPPADWERLWRSLLGGEASAVRIARAALGEVGSGHASGAARKLGARWASEARRLEIQLVDTGELGDEHGNRARVLVRGVPGYPSALLECPHAPEVLFSTGHCLDPGQRAVAIVGTRSSTYYGTEVASELGDALTSAGVTVVSGLASGIDAAAHAGACTALRRSAHVEGAASPAGSGAPIGVLGAGIDVVYPRSTGRLRARVEATGMLLSEAPPGAPPDPWRFPLRNRIIAGLVPLVIVVESHRAGGALHTVEAAITRNIEVMAVPGSIRSPASAGTNALIANGAHAVTSPEDVLVALERIGVPVIGPRRDVARPASARGAGASDTAPDIAGARLESEQRAVLAAVEMVPTPTAAIMARTGRSLEAVSLALEQLAVVGFVRDYGGAWGRTA